MSRRVVVTGMGVLTANADSLEAFSRALREGISGIGSITQFDTGPYSCKIAGEIASIPFEDSPADGLDRATRLILKATDEALAHSALSPADVAPGMLGVCIGTTCGGVHSLEKVSAQLEAGMPMDELPDWRFSELTFYAVTDHVARRVGATGPVITATVACASGSHAVGVGTDLIRAGRAEVMIVGGVDVISRFIFRGFNALSGLGALPYRAFDKNRRGVVLGEGAGVIVLESLEHARRRGAECYAEILGHSFNNDGCHIVLPNPTGEGIARSFLMALDDAGLRPEQIDHINAHGTGTHANDSAETAGIRAVFGSLADSLPVASIKPMTGHTSGAAGVDELIAAILSLRGGFVPPTLNFETPDPDCNLRISSRLEPLELHHVLSANSGFGGSNAAVVAGRCLESRVPASRREERVVVTGMGLALPETVSLEAFASLLTTDHRIDVPPQGGWETPKLDFFAVSQMQASKDARRMDQFSHLAAVAGYEALKDAALWGEELPSPVGLVLGSSFACIESNEQFAAGLSKAKVNPVLYQNTVSNSISGYMAMVLGLKGPVSVLNQGFLAGAASIAYAFDLIRMGRASLLLAGGAERQSRISRLVLARAGLHSDDGSSRPYDPTSRGLVQTDGGAFVVLESLTSAKARGARIYAELTGYGFRSAAGERTPEGVELAAGLALETLPEGVQPVGVYSGAPGVPWMDSLELTGLERAFVTANRRGIVNSLKGRIGEPLGAFGALALIASLLARRAGIFPGMPWLEAESSIGRLELRNENRCQPLDSQLILSTDKSGSCVALAIRAEEQIWG